MARYSDFDGDIKGQMDIEELYAPPERLVAVSKIFARARKTMSLAEQKTFIYALSQLDWSKPIDKQRPILHLDKRVLQQILGYKSDNTDVSQHMWDAIRDLASHSYVQIANRDRGIYDCGFIVTRITMLKNADHIRIRFNEEYLPLFSGLDRDYITMWSTDIFKMSNKRSVQFYELLRQMSYEQYEVSPGTYSYGWGIRALKEKFDIPKDGKGSYMSDGHFQRTHFERRVLDPICEDLLKCTMIRLVIQPDGKPYEKVKEGYRVSGYQFTWTFTKYPKVADASEVKEIQERVDKNPQILKVAKDIVTGEKKQKKQKTAQKEKSLTQLPDGMTIDDIEQKLLMAGMGQSDPDEPDDPDELPGQTNIFDYL